MGNDWVACVCVNRPPQTQLVLNNKWWYSNPSRGTEIARLCTIICIVRLPWVLRKGACRVACRASGAKTEPFSGEGSFRMHEGVRAGATLQAPLMFTGSDQIL
eukprot:scaffold43094_cov67-Attheya_sp.AAC.1